MQLRFYDAIDKMTNKFAIDELVNILVRKNKQLGLFVHLLISPPRALWLRGGTFRRA
jgi:hypothetical protein